MVLDNIEQLREHEPERVRISSYVEIAIQSMEEPQSGIGRMIQALLFSLGEQVRNETIAYIVRERAENIASFDVAPCGAGEVFQAEHGITPPIGEPVIPSNHRTYLVTRCMRPYSVPEVWPRGHY